ncbi:CHAT domain-containing protein [Kribbella sp. NPDC026611]|uniref:CHAT domain-containing protein n=1 Tax=Kribbella sp. NPDC026611 TaxID=3154911 RepID=UPI0033E85C11
MEAGTRERGTDLAGGRAAALNYYSHAEGLVISVVTPAPSTPLTVEVPADGPDSPVRRDYLSAAASRLIIDVHGLPSRWDTSFHAGRLRQALALPPSVNAAKRSGPVLQRKLRSSSYRYGLDYLERLGDVLFPAVVRSAIEDCDVLCIVSHGPLHAIPFAALPWNGHQRLGQRFGLTHVPSASLVPLLRERTSRLDPGGRPRKVFTAAVAAAEDLDPEDFEQDNRLLAALTAGLGGTCHELVGASGPKAVTKSAVRQGAADHDLVHFACHGVFLDSSGDAMQTSGLLLSANGVPPQLSMLAGDDDRLTGEAGEHLLTAEEVLAMDLNADLVTLRACSSGRSAVLAGDELMGLTRAFMFAGTASMLASLWNVNKLSSRLLLTEFYRRWLPTDGESKWQALQGAQDVVRQTDGYEHPFHWAAFALLGNWR